MAWQNGFGVMSECGGRAESVIVTVGGCSVVPFQRLSRLSIVDHSLYAWRRMPAPLLSGKEMPGIEDYRGLSRILFAFSCLSFLFLLLFCFFPTKGLPVTTDHHLECGVR
jgi:hypothetical protein